jgi:hypothetical protein
VRSSSINHLLCCLIDDTRKRKTTTATSLGSRSMSRCHKKKCAPPTPLLLSADDLLDIKYILKESCTCVSKRKDGYCTTTQFSDLDKTITDCRQRLTLLRGHQLQSKTYEILRTTLINEAVVGRRKSVYQYRVEGRIVCKNTFLKFYDIIHSWIFFCSAVKRKSDSNVNPEKVVYWDDSHINPPTIFSRPFRSTKKNVSR